MRGAEWVVGLVPPSFVGSPTLIPALKSLRQGGGSPGPSPSGQDLQTVVRRLPGLHSPLPFAFRASTYTRTVRANGP